MKSPNAFEIQENFLDDRPVMRENNQDINLLLSMLVQEVAEIFEEPHGMSPEKYMEQELADVAIFAISALDLLTGDAHLAIREKQARNTLKYPAVLFQSGDYEAAKAKSKEQWTAEDNEDFYHEE